MLPDAVAGLLLGVCTLFRSCLSSSTTTLWLFLLTIAAAKFSEVSLPATGTRVVLCRALCSRVIVTFVATVWTAVWWYCDLVEALLIRREGDGRGSLLAGVKDPLGPLGRLSNHRQCDCFAECHVRLGKEVLLELHVVDPVDEQPEDDGVPIGDLGLAGHVTAGELHVAMPCLGLEVC